MPIFEQYSNQPYQILLMHSVYPDRPFINGWGGSAEPEPDRLHRIQALSRAADRFSEEKVDRAPLLMKMKVKDRKTLLDFIATGDNIKEIVETLITEAKLMREAHSHLGLNGSRTRPNEAWRAEVSVPGSPE